MGIGQRFKSIDDAYRQYIYDIAVPEKAIKEDLQSLGPVDKVRTISGALMAEDSGRGQAIRYGVPATGLTAAGMGLVAVMNQFGGPEDQPEPGTLEILQAAERLRG